MTRMYGLHTCRFYTCKWNERCAYTCVCVCGCAGREGQNWGIRVRQDERGGRGGKKKREESESEKVDAILGPWTDS